MLLYTEADDGVTKCMRLCWTRVTFEMPFLRTRKTLCRYRVSYKKIKINIYDTIIALQPFLPLFYTVKKKCKLTIFTTFKTRRVYKQVLWHKSGLSENRINLDIEFRILNSENLDLRFEYPTIYVPNSKIRKIGILCVKLRLPGQLSYKSIANLLCVICMTFFFFCTCFFF